MMKVASYRSPACYELQLVKTSRLQISPSDMCVTFYRIPTENRMCRELAVVMSSCSVDNDNYI
eukprot:scaffold361165_cov34-Prasinocladus_malaysianus.AAC.1